MNKLSNIVKDLDVFKFNFKFEMIEKEQRGSIIGGVSSLLVYTLYLVFTYLIAENFWTHDNDSYLTNMLKFDYIKEDVVHYN